MNNWAVFAGAVFVLFMAASAAVVLYWGRHQALGIGGSDDEAE